MICRLRQIARTMPSAPEFPLHKRQSTINNVLVWAPTLDPPGLRPAITSQSLDKILNEEWLIDKSPRMLPLSFLSVYSHCSSHLNHQELCISILPLKVFSLPSAPQSWRNLQLKLSKTHQSVILLRPYFLE